MPTRNIYAGFYANLIGFSKATKIVFYVEFLLLLILGIVMYGFYIRERGRRSVITFNNAKKLKDQNGRIRSNTAYRQAKMDNKESTVTGESQSRTTTTLIK